ncbi:hypothetical protein FHS61_003172 [Altererythrobacter atlanticus]|uniref:Sulfotransferase domain protein n=2 Tax=Croceibacterium atlanticum TaxID=1267766 RepID=A0A0F7KLD0_9SPHN|nr:Sulfotransferase domain protein [Croceibacterium atlanticum]MBB5734122.1 hypothetical protein [Croceibacterium atlanticum]
MIASMIGGHSQIACLPESHFIQEFAETPLPPAQLLPKILNHRRFELWKLGLEEGTVQRLSALPNFATLVAELAKIYCRQQGCESVLTWVEHAPRNVGSFLRLKEQFPHARFIHVIRDGRAVAASWLDQDWGPRHVITVADTWALRIAQGLAAEFAIPDRVLRIHYESVVADPEAAMRKVAAFIGVEFEREMLAARGFALPSHSRKTHELLTGETQDGVGVSRERTETWRHKLTSRQIELFEQRTGDLLPSLGYGLTTTSPPGPTRSESIGMLWAEFFERAKNIPVRNRRHGFRLFR